MCAHNPFAKRYIFNPGFVEKNVACLKIAEGLYILEKDAYAISPENAFLNNMFCNTKALE